MTIKPEEVEEALGDYDANKPEEVNAKEQYIDSQKTHDPDWINGEFEGEVFLSTDGKNTVHVKAKDRAGRKAALEWAKAVYEGLREIYGTKQSQAVREYAKNGETQHLCNTHNTPMRERKGPHGTFYSHAKEMDGEWIYCKGEGWGK